MPEGGGVKIRISGTPALTPYAFKLAAVRLSRLPPLAVAVHSK